MNACPAVISNVSDFVLTRSKPYKTIVYSSNSGVWPDSVQPARLFIREMLTLSVPLFTRPINSSIIFGLFPAALIMDGDGISDGIRDV